MVRQPVVVHKRTVVVAVAVVRVLGDISVTDVYCVSSTIQGTSS